MNYLHFSKNRLLAFLAAASCLFAAEVQAQGNSVKTNPTKSNTKNGCEYQTISGLAEVVSIEKVVPKDSSILEYDEYAIKFKFIPKEGGQLMSTYRDQELDFYLTAQGETFNVGPQYIRQYQIRKNTKYSMRIMQGPLCAEKLKFDNMAGGVGLPNDVFEAEKNVGKIKEWKAAQLLIEKENAFAEAHPDLLPEEEKTAAELSEEEKARKAAEEQAAAEEEEARKKRETEFMLKEQELARKAAGLDNGDPDNEGNPDENTTVTPDGGNPAENPTPTDPDEEPENPATDGGGDEPNKYSSTATVTKASTTNTANPDSTSSNPTNTDSPTVTENPNGGNGIDEEALRAEVAAQVAKELEEKRIREEKLAAEKKAKEDAARKKEEERLAKIKAKEDEKRRKEEEKLKKEEEARLARQREIEDQQRKAQEERIKKDLADKIRQDMLKEAEEKAKAEAEAKAKAEEEAKAEAERKAAEEAKAAAEKKAQEDEIKRGECSYQTKIAGTIQVTSVKKINTSEESRLGYAEYEVKVKFTPSSADDLPKNTKKMLESEYTFVIDAQGKSANPSAAYIKKYSVNPNARFNGFAQVLNSGICNQVIFFSKDLPIDPAQTNLK